MISKILCWEECWLNLPWRPRACSVLQMPTAAHKSRWLNFQEAAWHHLGSLKSNVVGVFASWKPANAINHFPSWLFTAWNLPLPVWVGMGASMQGTTHTTQDTHDIDVDFIYRFIDSQWKMFCLHAGLVIGWSISLMKASALPQQETHHLF